MKILCSGDLHVGRRATRLPEDSEARSCSCATAWNDIVELAKRERVDLVALSGDLIDRANRYYEAIGPLERGIRALAANDIPTFAVAGNHDFDVLPRLSQSLPDHFKLLGADGNWERTTVDRDGGRLHLYGWSFTREHMRSSPLPQLAIGDGDGAPTLGLLHADLDQPDSIYAPVALADLQRLPVSAWLLGHVHRPSQHRGDGSPLVFYPGSPMAMDPGETGVHGAWIMQLERGKPIELRQVPTSRVRYHRLSVDFDGVTDDLELHRRVPDAVRSYLQSLLDADDGLKYICLRLVLKGRTNQYRRISALAEQVRQQLRMEHNSVLACVEEVEVETRPAIDLGALAKGQGPPAALASTILALQVQELDESHRQFVRETLRRWESHCGRTNESLNRNRPAEEHGGDESPPNERTARDALVRQGFQLLDALLAQQEAAEG